VKVGDIVKVRLREAPEDTRIGVLISLPRKMYMAGNIAEVIIDGKIKRVKEEHVQIISEGENK
jgi:hypothetical protein